MTRVAPHPEPDVWAAFIHGNVDEKELRALTEHLLDCEECRTVIRAGATFQRESGTAVRTKHRGSARWAVAATLLLGLAVVPPLYRWYSDPLRRLQGELRRTEGRITAFGYAPFTPAQRASATETTAALARLQQQVNRTHNSENLHRLALGQLAVGHAREAHQLLIEALALEPRNGALWSDIAVAKIALGETADAAEASARALEYEPRLAPAAFNLALSLNLLEVRPSAADAWRAFLRVEPSGPWAEEAHGHLEGLVPAPQWNAAELLQANPVDPRLKAMVMRHPQQARKTVLSTILPRWVLSADSNALQLARGIAKIRAASGDPFLLDIVEHATANREQIRAGMLTYASASEDLTNRNTEVAGAKFAVATRQLRTSDSPLAMSAATLTASCDFYGGRSQEALARLDEVHDEWAGKGSRYPGVVADEEWVRGLILSRVDANGSLEAYRRGIAAARRGGEVEHEAALLGLVVEIMDRVEDTRETDRLRVQSLRRLQDTAATSDRMYNAFSSAAYAMLRSGRPRVAMAFIDAQEKIARASHDALQLAESATERALAFRDLGRMEEAKRHLHLAEAPATNIRTPALRDRTLSNLALVAGIVYGRTDSSRAVSELTSAITTWERYGWRIHTATAYLLRGEVLARTNSRAAESDFRAGIAEMERQRDRLAEPRLRVTYFERADRLFSRLVELLIDQGRNDEALQIAERKRAHEILVAIGTEASPVSAPITTAVRTVDVTQLTAAVDAETAVVEYMLLDRGAVMWLVDRRGMFFAQSPARREAIDTMITSYLRAIGSNDVTAVSAGARSLQMQLIAPLASRLTGITRLALILDDRLQLIPFAALQGADGRYLLEDFAITLAPSGSTLIHGRRIPSHLEPLLAVAEPEPAGEEVLPHAEHEVREIADLYRDPSVYVGDEISPEEFLRRAGTAGIVHFAGHSRVNPYEPRTSALLFAHDASTAAILNAATISNAWLQSRPLVVLAGCSTGTGPLRRNEGPDSLSTAFLRAGARGVVATLWDVDDATTAALVRRFHERLSGGRDPANALREAQLEFIQSAQDQHRRPDTWAAYALFGN